MTMLTLKDIKNAQIEIVDGVGHSSGIYGETIETVYAESAEAYIDELRYPVNLVQLFSTYGEDDIETFNIKVDGLIYKAYDIGGEYLAIDNSLAFMGSNFSIFAIDSII